MAKPSLIKFNLQLFAEEFSAEPVVEDVVVDTDTGDTDPVEPFGGYDDDEPDQTQSEPDYSAFLEAISSKAKYNGEPLKINSFDEVIEKVQKATNYDKIYEKKTTLEKEVEALRNSSEVRFATELARRYGYDSVAEYEAAVKAAWEQEQLDELIQQNIPEEYAKEMLESRKFREEMQNQRKAQDEQTKQKQAFEEFLSEYPDVKADQIPVDVWELAAKYNGDLTKAYALYESRNKDKLKVQAQQETLKAIRKNAETSTGSVTPETAGEPENMTPDQVDRILSSLTGRERSQWIDKNFDLLEKSGYFKNF